MEECPNAYHRWSTRALPTAVTYQGLLQQKNQITSDLGKMPPMREVPGECAAHSISGCSALAQTRYLQRHNNAFKILFFEVLRSLDLITKVEPWFAQVTPKPLYENEHATAFWDFPLFADTTQVKANRIDATVIDKTSKQVRVIEMSCPWLENREGNEV